MKKQLLTFVAVFLIAICISAQNTWYVKFDGNDTKNGKSWTDAFSSLQKALDAAKDGDQIWVAEGVYKPTKAPNTTTTDTTARDRTFLLKSGVAIYGGFLGTETTLSQRKWKTNITTLSGDIGLPNVNTDNTYHVVVSVGDSSSAGTLDGFTIISGNANNRSSAIDINGESILRSYGGGICNFYSSPTLSNIIITASAASSGGGIYNEYASPTITDATIRGNAANYGGGICNISSSPTLINSVISSNIALEYGGGIDNEANSVLTLIGVTISGNTSEFNGGGISNTFATAILTNTAIIGNTAGNVGGGIFNSLSVSTLTNVTISGNTAADGGGIYNFQNSSPVVRNTIVWGNNSGVVNSESAPVYNYCLIQGLYPEGEGNLDGVSLLGSTIFVNPSDTLKAPTTSGNYRLADGSPAINAGSNAVYHTDSIPNLSQVTTDLANRPRIIGNTVDLGAYEYGTATSINAPQALAVPFSVYPNPTTGIVYIETNGNTLPEVRIYTVIGKLTRITKGNKIDLSDLPNGVYILQIENQRVRVVKR